MRKSVLHNIYQITYIMLIEFTAENFRSLYERKTFSLEAQMLSEPHEESKENICEVLSYKIVKTSAIYGANSSGKSNFIRALLAMKTLVLLSVKLNPNDTLPFEPFLLLKNNKQNTLFEISFLKDGFCYRYGFSYTQTEIVDEWLFRKTTPRSKEQALFIRNNDGIAFEDKIFPEGIGLESRVNNNRLFLSLCSQLGGKISTQVISWFEKDFNFISGLNNQDYRNFSQILFHERNEISKNALDFFKKLQLGFNDILTREVKILLPNETKKEIVTLLKNELDKRHIITESVHNIYDEKGNICDEKNFAMDRMESAGTKKMFDISGPIFDTLKRGTTLVIDELDAKMHPLISQQIISLFNSTDTNPNNAQLIFSTHDTHLLSTKMLRRDQIWFTEKNDAEQTDLYCLTDIVLPDGSKPRNDANYEKNYIAGRYGAIPYIVND